MNRNDKCFCGSNVKYKNCCKKKKDSIDTTDITAINKIYNEGRKKARFRECHHPLKDDCSEKIISAHSIQNNKILSKIADSGKVLMPIPKKLTFEEQTEYGRKEATVFTGFCKVHDKYTFQAIEDRDFIASEEQVFLHIYRTFVLELHKKEEGHRFFQYLFSKMPSLAEQSFEKTKHLWSLKVGHEDLLIEKKEFDNALIEKILIVYHTLFGSLKRKLILQQLVWKNQATIILEIKFKTYKTMIFLLNIFTIQFSLIMVEHILLLLGLKPMMKYFILLKKS